jgi:hypothetical protein
LSSATVAASVRSMIMSDEPAMTANLTESYFVNQLLLRIKQLPRLTSAED